MKETHIKKRSDGKYIVRVVIATHNPKTGDREDVVRSQSGISTLGEARNVRIRKVIEAKDAAEAKKKGVVTIQQGIDLFVERRGHEFAPSSLVGLKQNLDRYLDPIKSLRVTTITRSQLEDLFAPHQERVATATLDRVATNIRALFKFLQERGAIQENPAQFIKFKSKKMPHKKLTAMSQGDIQRLLTSCVDHPFYPIFFIAYNTGARSGELAELKFSDFDFENNILTIGRNLCKITKTVKAPKSGFARSLHVNDGLAKMIKELKLKSNGSEYILPREKQFMRGESAKVLRAIQRELGIPETNFHSLRASFITHLLLARVPVTTVQHIVGHADLKTTQEYVRLCASDLVGATDSLQKNSPLPKVFGTENVISFPSLNG